MYACPWAYCPFAATVRAGDRLRVSKSFLRRQLLTLLEPYRPAEARVRLMMTKQGQVYIAIEPLRPLPREIYENGVRVETTELHRDHPSLKSTSFIMASASERKHIAHAGIFEALLVKDGKILEGMTSNFFYVKDNVVYTAQDEFCSALHVKRSLMLRGAGEWQWSMSRWNGII